MQAIEMTPNNNVEAANAEATTTTQLNKPILKRGSKGTAVVELQKLLTHWGYYFGPLNGEFDIDIEYAVKAFQHRVFLKEDGIVASLTWQALYSGAPVNMPILRRGSSGQFVKIVQEVLQMNGFYPYAIDGIFGSMTEVAVRSFQLNSGLPADGIVGPRTWYALSKLPH
jgi:peptidoglycan hydrolase-like protein with peptidoglycan-binding domain